MTGRAFGAIGVAAIVTIATMPILLPRLRRRLRQDTPNERSSHTAVTPRGGGLATTFAAAVATLALSGAGRVTTLLVLVVVLTAAVGLADDIRPLGAKRRLASQVILGGATLSWFAADGLPSPAALAVVIAVVGFVSYVNAFNFMDGINGISSLQAIAAGGAYLAFALSQDSLVLAVLGGALVGAGAGFLPFNLRRTPLVFLGDVGSYGFGAAIASAALVAWKVGARPEVALFPLAIYLADTGSTIVRRLRRGENVFDAHRDHVYQRITPHGAAHGPRALLVGACSAVVGGLGVATQSADPLARLSLGLCAAVVVVFYLSLPRLLGHASTSMVRAA